MQVDIISRTPAEAQTARAVNLPEVYVRIGGTDQELDEPAKLIREAALTISAGKAAARKPAETALKAFGLLFAASLRAQKLRDWSTTGNYDPLPDVLAIQATAKRELGPDRGRRHPVTQLRAALVGTIRSLRERPA